MKHRFDFEALTRQHLSFIRGISASVEELASNQSWSDCLDGITAGTLLREHDVFDDPVSTIVRDIRWAEVPGMERSP